MKEHTDTPATVITPEVGKRYVTRGGWVTPPWESGLPDSGAFEPIAEYVEPTVAVPQPLDAPDTYRRDLEAALFVAMIGNRDNYSSSCTDLAKYAIEYADTLIEAMEGEYTDGNNINEWKLIPHSWQIADTGDYDGVYEITNGKISLLTNDDDDEALQPIVDALNDSGAKLYQDDSIEFERDLLKKEVKRLTFMIDNKLRWEDMEYNNEPT